MSSKLRLLRAQVFVSASVLVGVCGWLACIASCGSGQDGGDAALVPDARVEDPLAACVRARGVAPVSIAELVQRINALPPPASIPCLLASLPRPLSLVFSSSPSSAQPAGGHSSPRTFILLPALTLTVVPTGEGSHLLEVGEWVTPVRSTKAELAFPVTRPVQDDEPFRSTVRDAVSVTNCGLCHIDEEAHPTIAGAFVSDALRPAPVYEVSLVDVQRARAACDWGDPPECAMLRSLLDYGPVRQGNFNGSVRPGF